MTACARLSILVMFCVLVAGEGDAGQAAKVGAEAPPAVAMPPLEAFRETVARPLFVRGRRPPGTPVAAPMPGAPLAPPPSAPRLSVAGIAIAGNRRSALVVVDGAPKPLSLAEGGEVSGWTVTSIASDRIRLEKGDEAFEAALRGFKKGG